MAPPDTLPGRLLASFAAAGTLPRLTWYAAGPDGDERVELSGRVLANWVTKAANLLVTEADSGPGTAVVLDLPVHWRTVVWALASWTTGARLAVVPDDAADVVVTAAPEAAPDADLLLAVPLPALAMSWDGPVLPPGAVDAAAETLGQADVLGPVRTPAGEDPAWGEVTFDTLGAWAGDGSHGRALLTPEDVTTLLRQALAVWLAGGSVVLVPPGADRGLLDRVSADERVDHRVDAAE
ncbi:TIGR03089 family protein [Georgenia alba]|uniref:TIGR03089 family protein n=1 Tax=Georgenia alba TaxID=2233858 RepID=A0ABW2QCD7_9MICO